MNKLEINLISIKLTNACNLKCNMCWQTRNHHANSNNINYKDFMIILKKIQFLSPNKIYLWGGEPLLHPKIIDIIKSIKQHKFMCHLITNGTLLDKYADDLINAKTDVINISLDGIGETHDAIRGVKGTYKKVMTGLNKLLNKKKFRPIVSINTVINKINYTKLYDIVKQLSKLKLNGLQIQLPVFFNQKDGLQSEIYLKKILDIDMHSWAGFVDEYSDIDTETLNTIILKIKTDFPKVAFYPSEQSINTWFNTNTHHAPLKCCMPWRRINIEPNGDMNICTDYADMIAGNLLKKSFNAIWNNKIYNEFRKQIKQGNYMPICQYCTYSHLPWSK